MGETRKVASFLSDALPLSTYLLGFKVTAMTHLFSGFTKPTAPSLHPRLNALVGEW
jgi:hypothetical protein